MFGRFATIREERYHPGVHRYHRLSGAAVFGVICVVIGLGHLNDLSFIP